MKETFSKRFKSGIEEYGLKYEDVIMNWRYYGGDYDRHLRYYKLCSGGEELPEHNPYCVCGQKIKRNCYLTKDDQILVLGNCCIKRFVHNSGRTCSVCGLAHLNRKTNFCNMCKNPEYRYKYIYERIYKSHN